MVTLADLVAVESLGLRPVHLADDAALRWVATSELTDPSPYLEGGELLLTTGLETGSWHTEWDEYVARLVAVGAAGLALGIGLTHPSLPERLVEACRARGLTLLEVPRSTHFVAISRAAADLLQEEEASTTRLSLDFQRRLTQAALGLDQRPLLERLAEVLAGGVALVDRDGAVLDGPFGSRASLLDLEQVRPEVVGIRRQGLGAVASTTRGAVTTVVRPIGIAGRADHYLAAAWAGSLGDPQRSAVTTAAVLLSLALERRNERRGAERRLRERALDFLVAGDPTSATVLLEAVERDVAVPPRLRALRATGDADQTEDALRRLEDDGVLAGVVGQELVAVVAPARAAPVADLLADLGLVVGVGRAVGAAHVTSSHETAGQALARTTASQPVRRWDDVADGGPLALVPPDAGRAYATALLEPLDDELRLTLAAFLRHHGSRGAVAADLGVHRNTVRNRVAEIERLLGADLDEPAARFGAWLALETLAGAT